MRAARTWAATAFLCVGLTGAGAFAQVISEPPVAVPQLPSVGAADVEIADLELAPPLAQPAIVDLVALGAYPLDADLRAHPNLVLTAEMAAYMLVNVFSLDRVDQFPVPASEALAYLEVVAGVPLAADLELTVGQMRDFILAFANLLGVDTAVLDIVLTERYPALEAGNLEAPITRAGGALMIVIALQSLSTNPG